MSAWGELPRPFVLGHRGVRGPARPPENTLAAIEAARAAGAHGVEIDVRPCATSELVVLHDARLGPSAGGLAGRAVGDVGWSALCRLDLGGGERVPRLEEVLEHCERAGLALNVELKHDVPSRRRAARAAARVLRRASSGHPLIVSSFDPVLLAAFAALGPRVPRALLVHRAGPALLAGAIRAGAAARALGAVALHPERTQVDPRAVAAWRALGLGVGVWTVNSPEEARDLLALGVDGLISDDPAAVLAVLATSRGPSGRRDRRFGLPQSRV